LPANGNIYLIGALCFVVALYGYRLIHRLQKLLSILSLLVFVAATLFALQLSIPPEQWLPTGFSLSKFLVAVSIAVTWQLSYAPYVADYSRYLPSQTPTAKVFWYSYAGTVSGGAWMMILGAILRSASATFPATSAAMSPGCSAAARCCCSPSSSTARCRSTSSTCMAPSCRPSP
jgi:NCS1 family nucleobase:cation symporter-1